MAYISLIWQVPLCILSLIFYRLSKRIIAKVFTRAVKKGKQQNKQWRCISKDVLKTPFMLPFIATQGPRWNPHAVITNIGPLPVKGGVSIDLASVNRSAKNWTLVIYSHPEYKTVKSIGSNTFSESRNNEQTNIDLDDGVYSFSIRYYDWEDEIAFPALTTASQEVVETRWISGDVNDFYHTLIEADSWFYRFTQYHIYPLLKLKAFLSKSQLQSFFLPVGNPDTRFNYDRIKAGETINATISQSVLDEARLYVCIYNKSSFPVNFYSVNTTSFNYTATKNGYYLFRLCCDKEENADNNILQLEVNKTS